MTREQERRLKELEANANRTTEEEAVRTALVELGEKIEHKADPATIDAARKAVNDAEAAVAASVV